MLAQVNSIGAELANEGSRFFTSMERSMPLHAQKWCGRAAARLVLLLCTMLLLVGHSGAPATAIGGPPLYLPLMFSAGQAQIGVTTELVSNSIVKPGDRIRINFRVRNDGTAPTTANTLISLPFDK